MAKVCILGGGSWGIGLSVVLHKNGHEVTVWSAVPAEIQMLQENHEHKMLPGVKLPEDMIFTTMINRPSRARTCWSWQWQAPIPEAQHTASAHWWHRDRKLSVSPRESRSIP